MTMNHCFCVGNIVIQIFHAITILCNGYQVGGYVLCQNDKAQMPCQVSIAQKIDTGLSNLRFYFSFNFDILSGVTDN